MENRLDMMALSALNKPTPVRKIRSNPTYL
jgi:hypothetical protein